MRYYKFIFFLFLTSFSFSQNSYREKEKLSITISPLSLIDIFDGSSLRLGIEKQFTSNLSSHIESGFYLGNLNIYKRNPKGYLYKVGLNYTILKNENEDVATYLGVEYQYKDQDYEYVDSFAVNSIRFEKKYKMNRIMNCFSLKIGAKPVVMERIYADMFVGLGVRYMNSTNNLSEEENDGLLFGEENGYTQADSFLNQTGKYPTINFIFGFKFGYRIF